MAEHRNDCQKAGITCKTYGVRKLYKMVGLHADKAWYTCTELRMILDKYIAIAEKVRHIISKLTAVESSGVLNVPLRESISLSQRT